MSKHIPQVPGQFTEGDEGLPEFWQKEFATSKEVAAAMKLLDITSIQTCPKCRQMWVNLNDEKCRKCGASMVHVVETKPVATVHGTGSGEAKTCPECGYTEADARFNMDHHLCRNAGRAPWEPLSQIEPTPTPSASPTVTLDRETFDRLVAKAESIERAAVHGTFYHTVAIDLLALLRAAERHQL